MFSCLILFYTSFIQLLQTSPGLLESFHLNVPNETTFPVPHLLHFLCTKTVFTNCFYPNVISIRDNFKLKWKSLKSSFVKQCFTKHFFWGGRRRGGGGFTPCKAEQPLQGIELQEKEAQKC